MDGSHTRRESPINPTVDDRHNLCPDNPWKKFLESIVPSRYGKSKTNKQAPAPSFYAPIRPLPETYVYNPPHHSTKHPNPSSKPYPSWNPLVVLVPPKKVQSSRKKVEKQDRSPKQWRWTFPCLRLGPTTTTSPSFTPLPSAPVALVEL